MKKILFYIIILSGYYSFGQSQKTIAEKKIQTIETTVTDERKADVVFKHTITNYDSHGNIIEVMEFDKSGKKNRWEKSTFNNNNDETAWSQLDTTGIIVKSSQTEYDKWNEISVKTYFDAAGSVTEKTNYTYNSMNNLIAEETSDGSGKLIRRSVYEYDEKGMQTSKKIFNDKVEVIFSRTNVYSY